MPENDLHLPPGKGSVDFKNIFNSLRTIGYTGTATLELKPVEIKSCLGFVKNFYVHNTCFFIANATITWYLILCVIFSFERYPHSRKQVWINNRKLP